MLNTTNLEMQHNRQITQDAVTVRINNIISFSELPREELEFNKHERRLLLHTTSCGEQISIQYPGKESISNNPSKVRPWDFRPKLMSSTGDFLKDLSFSDIWDDLTRLHNIDGSLLAILAALFYRMSAMVDHKKTTDNYEYTDIAISENTDIGNGTISFTWYKYEPDSSIISELNEQISLTLGVSLEGYLLYNDLLVQNEDCKYYYRANVLPRDFWDGNWNPNNGRRNTLFSHLSVIEFLKGEISFTEIMKRFQRGMGVAPIPVRNIESVTDGIIKTS